MTKIDIFSGFLGAGKTTLIKKLITEAFAGQQVVLIENEFGEIGIDGGFLKESGIQINELNAGCICCSLVGDFRTALQQVVEQYHPDRIVIEPSGVGKLSDVTRAVEGVAEHLDVQLNSFVTVADVNKVKMYMKNFGEFYDDQISHASCILLSRTQTASEEKIAAAVAMLREKNPTATIVTTAWDHLTGEQILKAMSTKDDFKAELIAMAAKANEEHAHEDEEEEHEHHHHHYDENGVCSCGHHHDHDDDDDEDEHEHHHHDHEDHDHDHDDHCCCDHDHDHEHEHETDEHIWTSPKNAQLMLSAVYDAICKVDPSDKQTYTKNKDAYAKQLSDLDNAYRSAVDNAKNKTIVLADKFPFRYLAHEYGLEFSAAFAACSDESEPGVSTMIKLTKTIKENNIPAVYYLEFSSTKIADTLCDETGATKLMLHSCHNVSKQDIENNVSYVDLMKQNLENLKVALNG